MLLYVTWVSKEIIFFLFICYYIKLFSNSFIKAWATKAKGETASDVAETKKRKFVDESQETENQKEKATENLNLPKKQKPLDLSTNQKLSAFAFKQE